MLKAYIDESGIHKGSEVCVVAGYWAKKGPWRKFENGWRTVLRRFNVPLEKFHAKDAVNKTGFFLPWNRGQANDFLAELGQTTAASKVHPVSWGVFRDDFFSLSLAEKRFLTGGTWNSEEQRFLSTGSSNKPYFTCFTECVKIVTSYVPGMDKVDFFFGCDRPAGEYAQTLFRYWRWRAGAMRRAGRPYWSRISPEKFGLVSFPWAKETPPLQVADLLAYLTYRFMLEHRKNDLQAIPHEPLLSLVTNRKRPYDTQWRNAELMRQIIHTEVPNFPKE